MENVMMESRRAALTPEEAALKAALPRKSAAGGAALRAMMRDAERMNGVRLAGAAALMEEQAAPQPGAVRHVGRAALHQALRQG